MSLAGSSRSRSMLISIPRFYAVQALLRSIAPIIAAEQKLRGKAISEGWANVDEKELEKWSKVGQEIVQSEVRKLWDDTYDEEYARLFRRVSARRLWLRRDGSLTLSSASGIAEESQIRRDRHLQTVPRPTGRLQSRLPFYIQKAVYLPTRSYPG